MRRLLVFALLGPLLGFVMVVWVMAQVLNWATGGPTTFDYHQVVLIPFAYVFGILPALLAAWCDHLLAKRGVPYRTLGTTLFSYFMSFIPALGAISIGFMSGPYLLLIGLTGAVPGAICSWLAKPRSLKALPMGGL